MFMVQKMKEIKVKQNTNVIIDTPKKTNIFTQIDASHLKSEEKPSPSHNSFSFITNNSSDSGKGLISCMLNEKPTLDNNLSKNEFLSKKTKFVVDFIEKEKEIKKKPKEIKPATIKKKKKTKNISFSTEEDVNEGRWDDNEHLKFIEAINKFGNEWKEVQKYVGTRSSSQVRSHAQKFFLKLKAFKDLSLGFDFTDDKIKNLSDIIIRVKKFEEENKSSNILFLLNKKLLERSLKMSNDSLNQNKEEYVLVENNKIIINNEFSNGNINNSPAKQFLVHKKKKKKIFKNIKFNKNAKTIVNLNKFKKNEINYSNLESNEKIIKTEEKVKNEEESQNKMKNDEYIYKYDNNRYNFLGDYIYENSNQFECETNDKILHSFSYYNKESNTISLINRDFFC